MTTQRVARVATVVASCLALLASGACSDATNAVRGVETSTSDGQYSLGIATAFLRITVVVTPSTLSPPSQGQATATIRDARGNQVGGSVTWSSSNPAVATVSPTGVITAVSAGSVTVGATAWNGARGVASLTVIAPVPAGAVTPNILNNASFENDWSGFTDWGGVALPSGYGLSRDSTLAYDGSWSIKRAWTPNPSAELGTQLASAIGSADHVWVRFYFRLTAPITSIMKFMRFYTSGFGQALGGLFLGQGSDIFTFGTDQENSAITTSIGLTEARVIDGNWHSIEVEYWRNGDPSGWPSTAFWFDGQPLYLPDGTYVKYSCYQPSPPATCSTAYWQGGRLYTAARATSAQLGTMEWLATLNIGNTTTGQVNIDKISISTLGRIGP